LALVFALAGHVLAARVPIPAAHRKRI